MARGHVIVDAERCKGCELCASVCPKGGIQMSGGFNSKGYHPAAGSDPNGVCTGCALCALMCPDTAITVYREVIPRTVAAKVVILN